MVLLLSAVSATTTSSSVILANAARFHEFTWKCTTAPTGLTFLVEGSGDGYGVEDADAAWFSVYSVNATSAELTAKGGNFQLSDIPLKRVRITATPTGSMVALTVKYTEQHDCRA